MRKHVVEGVVVFRRARPNTSPDADCCRQQCGEAGHIKGRSLMLHSEDGSALAVFEQSVENFIQTRVLGNNGNEGKQVRVTVEVLD